MKQMFLVFLLLFPKFEMKVGSAYLMEFNSESVVYEYNSTKQAYPASLTKMMGLILVYEAIHSNQLKLDEIVFVSAHAANTVGNSIYLESQAKISVLDLIKAVCIASANDAMVALAERIAGSESGFVSMMNRKAKQMKLEKTHFTNSTGLHDPNHYSSAKDLARIAKQLILTGGEDFLAISSTYDAYIKEESASPFWLVNTNKLVNKVEGVNGLKTGYTQQSGSCSAISVKRDNLHFIGIALNAIDANIRDREMTRMIEYGYQNVDYLQLLKKGEVLQKIEFEVATVLNANLVYLEDLGVLVDKGKNESIVEVVVNLDSISLPIAPNQSVGTALVKTSSGYSKLVDIGVDQEVLPLTFSELFILNLKRLFL